VQYGKQLLSGLMIEVYFPKALAGMYQDVVAGSFQEKVKLMYQQREKFSSLNSLMTSSAKRQW